MIGIIAAAMTALISVVVWYLKYQTKQQTEREKKHDEQQLKREEKHDKQQDEDRAFHRSLIENDLKSIHSISLENSKLNSQSLLLQKEMMKEIKEHDGQSRDAWNKLNGSLGAICDKLNNRDSAKVSEKHGRKDNY